MRGTVRLQIGTRGTQGTTIQIIVVEASIACSSSMFVA
jgi:hypothetical protein